jgi:transposase
MARGVKKEVVYTGKALKLHEKVVKLEADLKAAKDELKVAYKEQVKAEKVAAAKAKKEADAALKKALKEKQAELTKALKESGKSIDDVIAMLNNAE